VPGLQEWIARDRSLARLRRKFGDDLFLRTRNGVTPTPKLVRRLNIAVVSHDYIAAPHSVAQSNLIATVPERLADLLVKQLPIRKYDCPVKVPGHAIRLYWQDRTHRSALHRWFRGLVAEVAAAL
jgi:DNA-binding transcriptional LysR family regulator